MSSSLATSFLPPNIRIGSLAILALSWALVSKGRGSSDSSSSSPYSSSYSYSSSSSSSSSSSYSSSSYSSSTSGSSSPSWKSHSSSSSSSTSSDSATAAPPSGRSESRAIQCIVGRGVCSRICTIRRHAQPGRASITSSAAITSPTISSTNTSSTVPSAPNCGRITPAMAWPTRPPGAPAKPPTVGNTAACSAESPTAATTRPTARSGAWLGRRPMNVNTNHTPTPETMSQAPSPMVCSDQ